MLKVLLVRPGSTSFDEQGRIKGSLDIPLNANGEAQAVRVADELKDIEIDALYTSPCQSAVQTAEQLARRRHLKVKVIDALKNLDHGLWHGKLVSEVKQQQPRLYRQWQDTPERVCPPQGETLHDAQQRVGPWLTKTLRKHREGVVAVVASEPMARIVRANIVQARIDDGGLGDLWEAVDGGRWELLPIPERASI